MKICEYRYDTSIKENLLPRFNSNYNYVVVDYNEGNNIRRRVIESEEYPTSINLNGESSLRELIYLDATETIRLTGAFKDCPNLIFISLSNTEKVIDVNHACYNCPNLKEVVFANCDLSKVTNATNIFNGGTQNSVTKLDLTNAKLSNATKDTIKTLTKMTTILIDGLDMNSATTMSRMFEGCSSLVEVDFTNVKMDRVEDLSLMLKNCSSLKKLTLKNKNLNHVTTMSGMFEGCGELTEVDLEGFKAPNVAKLDRMFYNCPNLQKIDLSSLGAKEVSDTSYMFGSATPSNITRIDLSGVKTIPKTNVSHVFYNCLSLEWVDLSNLDIGTPSNTTNFFSGGLTTLKEIGACYCSSDTINRLTTFNANCNYNLYYTDAEPSDLQPKNNCTFVYCDEHRVGDIYSPPSLTLRSHGDVCDEYNPLTSQFIQRIGEDGSILDNPIVSKVKSIVVHNDSIKYGYSLPNGVTDLYHPQTETYEQLIESATLDGSESWTKTNQTTYTTTFVGAKSDTSLEIFTMKEEIKEITIINDRLTITFNDNSYVVTNNLTLNAFKVWLQSNNIEFKYELKYEEYRKMTLEELDFNEFHSDSLVGSKSSTITQATKDDSVFAPITYQAKSNNRFELPLLESDVDYTIRYEGETTGMSLGGETITSVESNSVVQGGVGKVALFDIEVDELMLVKGDVRGQTFPYFKGLESVKQPVIKTVGKNVFSEDNTMELGGWNVHGGSVNSANEIRCKNNYTPFPKELKNGDKMYIVLSDTSINCNTNMHVYDENKERIVTIGYGASDYIDGTNFINGVATITVNDASKCGYFSFRAISSNTDCRFAIMINNVSPYEPHQSSTLNIPQGIVLRSIGNIQDKLDCNTGEYMECIGERDYQEGDEHDISVVTDFTKTQYVLETPITKTIDLEITQQNITGDKLFYHKDGHGELASNGTLPKFSYKLQSTNNYHAKDLKPNTTYTIYSDTESSVVNIGGKSNILLNSPQLVTSGSDGKNVRFESIANDIVVIEGDVVNQVVPYFTGKIDVVNPIVKTVGGNNSNTVQTSITLRSVNGVRDTYDMNTGVLTKRISDNHEILDYPQTITIPCDTPRIYSQGRIELSNNSDLSLLPKFEYSGKSPNFYPLAVDKNTTYTLKFDNAINGSVTLGGTTVGTNGNQIITTKNNTLQGVLFERDLGIDNLMVIRGDVRDVPMSYFQGIKNVVNPTITLDNGGGESNSLTLTLTMRSLPNGTKDELNLVTGDYVQRLDERPYQEGDIESDNLLTDGVTTIYPLSSPRRRRLNLEWSNGVLKAFEGTTNVTSEAEMLKPYLVVKLATSTLEDLLSKLKEENNGLLETVDKLEEDNLTTMIAVTEVFETVLVMFPFRMDEGISMGSTLKGGGSQMVEVYVTLILKGKKTIDQVPTVIRSQVEQMLKDLQTL